jgi:hypothetical protein
MATPKLAKAKKKPKVKGDKPRFTHRSFTPTKPMFMAPMQGLKHIIFNYTGTAKAASTFSHSIEALLKTSQIVSSTTSRLLRLRERTQGSNHRLSSRPH